MRHDTALKEAASPLAALTTDLRLRLPSDMASGRLGEVEALRQARLEAQSYAFQLEQARNELEHLRQVAAAQARQAQAAIHAPPKAAGGCSPAALQEALQEARLQAVDSQYRADLAELELAKQLDALAELQWQLECVVAQLGLAPPSAQPGAAPATQQQREGSRVEQQQHPACAGVDQMALLGKLEELRQAQLELGECKRRLAVAEARLDNQQQAGRQQTGQQQQQTEGEGEPAGQEWWRAAPRWQDEEEQQEEGTGMAVPAGPGSKGRKESGTSSTGAAATLDAAAGSRQEGLGSGGKQLVAELLQENEALRQQLAEAEESYRGLERDYEVELLTRADAEARQETAGHSAAAASAAGAARLPGCLPARQSAHGSPAGRVSMHAQTEMRASRLGALQQAAAAIDAGSGGEGSGKRRQGGAVSESMEHIARERLAFRLAEKDKQLGKLRGVVRELEGKLIEAHKRQADMVMKESSWREQESQDRRLARMEDKRARLEFAAAAAQAEAEAARKEALAQRRMVKRLQEQAAAAAAGAGGSSSGGGGSQMVELLQKRVKVLEAQNIRLRLQAKSDREQEEAEAAEAAAAAQRAANSQRREGQQAGAEAGGRQGGAAGENEPPNKAEAEGGLSLLDIPFARWEADKRLQKRVETLQARLRDKTTALVTAEAGRRRAEEQAEAAQAAALAASASLARAQAQLRQAEQRTVPGTMVPVGRVKEMLAEVEQLQGRYNELERRHAALQHRAAPGSDGNRPGTSAPADGCASPGAGRGLEAQQQGQLAPAAASPALTPAARCASPGAPGLRSCSSASYARPLPPPAVSTSPSVSALRANSCKTYQPADYGGRCGLAAGGEAGSAAGAGSGKSTTAGTASAAGQADLAAQLLEKDVALFDAQLQRDQAVADAERHRRRLHALLDGLSPHPLDEEAAAAIPEARQLSGLPLLPGAESAAKPQAAAGKPGKQAAGTTTAGTAAAGGAGKGRKPSAREQELLDTIALLKSALERTKKGLESGVSSSKYMAAVDRAKQLREQCKELEAQLVDADKVRQELSRVQQQLGQMHGTASALRSQLKAARDGAQAAVSAREGMLQAQVSELERALRERDAQMEALNTTTQQVDEEVRVLVAEGLRPADIIQELLVLRPRLRALEEENASLSSDLAGMEAAVGRDLAALQADHELLRRQCARYEEELRTLCQRHGEPLPVGLN